MPVFKVSLFMPAVHVVIWAILLAIPAFIFHNAPGGSGVPGAFFFFTNLYHVGLFYVNTFFLYPRLMTRRRWPLYLLSLVLILAGSYYGKLSIMQVWAPDIAVTPFIRRLLFFPPVAFLMASFVYSLVRDRIRLDRIEKERRAERLAAEVKFLRQQISPHFLFNMMTNMVSLARQGSPLLEPSLIKLSELLRYSLYESGDGKILLSSEVALVRNFVDLQQLRFGEDVEIRMDMPDPGTGAVIEPMLLIPFVENAFKHGIGMVKHAFIHVELRWEGSELYFMVSNNYNKDSLVKDKSPGIGLANTRSRLELLYPGRHKLRITDKDEIYTVELNLVLS
ncbi:histidine kinase [Flavitalea sp. BT771]|uniref:sensor histidine kinase n=1 Tax=Flavitalea sp. BT771 TaxID=3063329 RepID=UPI0026E485A4|nr:histidine kinase [Flavitalea sp. BT771]MDO6434881.1 histidine kinase [Flavitalea sp. BT771]MDV6223781.1 histidine kinase [Flavitalea sp. BT771]